MIWMGVGNQYVFKSGIADGCHKILELRIVSGPWIQQG
jgi:hypothetical protein